MERFQGFSPVFDCDSEVLILGSFPSVKSREAEFYYGNKRNRFWTLLSEFYGMPISSVSDKIRLCFDNKIALWDIVASCSIKGSMDSDITDFTLVNLREVLDKCNIRRILCNGAKSYELTKAAYDGDIPVIRLPSTSPANVYFDKRKWFDNLPKQ
ncbi:MAG: DNA-deoxyinosine glycosylase [Corallococcus sp.]|nr:DNA-deoxyinosine glycosylase [Bacillota bacterium]MCM1533615.1 DNA-deoxyinosine glycosylase [Corallococcus sp.]